MSSATTPDGKLTLASVQALQQLSEHQQDINDLDNGFGYRSSVAIDAALKILSEHGFVEVEPRGD
jgi:hypothetical protein